MKRFLVTIGLVFIVIPFPVYSYDSCRQFYGNKTGAESSQVQLISSKEYEITIQNRYREASQIWGEFINYLTTSPNPPPKVLNSLMSIKEILEFAVENTIQHGSNLTAGGDYSPNNKLKVQFDLFKDQDSFKLVISNPQIKPFPTSLEKEFFVGEIISVKDSERGGYQGAGLAHVGMQLALEQLPTGSSLKWTSNGSKVTFELKIKTK